jgi:hypothetical protein
MGILTLYTSNGLTYQVFECLVFTIRTVATLEDTAPAGATHRQSDERPWRRNQGRALAHSKRPLDVLDLITNDRKIVSLD